MIPPAFSAFPSCITLVTVRAVPIGARMDADDSQGARTVGRTFRSVLALHRVLPWAVVRGIESCHDGRSDPSARGTWGNQ